MDLVQAAVLGIVQGLTEFLPVSSSGHLVLVPALLHWPAAPLVFDTTVHLGTLVAVVAVFWSDIGRLLAAWWRGLRHRRPLETAESRLAWWIILGTVPAVAAGLLLESVFESIFGSPRAVGGFLLVTALLLLLAELLGRQRCSLSEMKWPDALLVGLGQAAAIAPGLSRSGATMATAMFRGLTRAAAARFSFLLSLPIIAGTGLVQLAKLVAASDLPQRLGLAIGSAVACTLAERPLQLALSGVWQAQVPFLFVGFAAAVLSGYVAVRLLLAYLRRWPLYPFAVYCVAVGLFALLAL